MGDFFASGLSNGRRAARHGFGEGIRIARSTKSPHRACHFETEIAHIAPLLTRVGDGRSDLRSLGWCSGRLCARSPGRRRSVLHGFLCDGRRRNRVRCYGCFGYCGPRHVLSPRQRRAVGARPLRLRSPDMQKGFLSQALQMLFFVTRTILPTARLHKMPDGWNEMPLSALASLRKAT